VRRQLGLLGLLILLLNAPRIAGAVTQSDFTNGDRERILEVILAEGGMLHNGVIAYQVGDRWYLPLSEIALALELFVKTLPNLVGAEGFILEESRKFELNLGACRLRIKSREQPYECTEAIAHEQDIYVESGLLSRWLPVKFEINPYKSRIIVTSSEKLPVQQRLEREGKSTVKGVGAEPLDPGYPRKKLGEETFSGPAVDQHHIGLEFYQNAKDN